MHQLILESVSFCSGIYPKSLWKQIYPLNFEADYSQLNFMDCYDLKMIITELLYHLRSTLRKEAKCFSGPHLPTGAVLFLRVGLPRNLWFFWLPISQHSSALKEMAFHHQPSSRSSGNWGKAGGCSPLSDPCTSVSSGCKGQAVDSCPLVGHPSSISYLKNHWVLWVRSLVWYLAVATWWLVITGIPQGYCRLSSRPQQ